MLLYHNLWMTLQNQLGKYNLRAQLFDVSQWVVTLVLKTRVGEYFRKRKSVWRSCLQQCGPTITKRILENDSIVSLHSKNCQHKICWQHVQSNFQTVRSTTWLNLVVRLDNKVFPTFSESHFFGNSILIDDWLCWKLNDWILLEITVRVI